MVTRRDSRFTVTVPIEVRRCTGDDLANLEWFGMYSAHRGIIHETFDAQQAGTAVMLAAVAGGFPVGQVWVDLDRGAGGQTAYIWALRVMTPFQRLGIARRLLHAAEIEAAAAGCVAADIEAEPGHARTLRFYQRLGYRVVSRRALTWRYRTPDGLDVTTPMELVRLRKPLPDAGSTPRSRAASSSAGRSVR